jgi:hypothetical protein
MSTALCPHGLDLTLVDCHDCEHGERPGGWRMARELRSAAMALRDVHSSDHWEWVGRATAKMFMAAAVLEGRQPEAGYANLDACRDAGRAPSAIADGLRDAGALAGPGPLRERMYQAADAIDALVAGALAAMYELDEEAQQRETSGNDEYSQDLREASNALRAGLVKAGAL